MAEFKFSILANSNPNDLRVLMYEVTAPNTSVASQDIAAPHIVSQQVVFTGLNKITHYVRIYQLESGNPTLLLGNHIVQPVEENLNQEENLILTVGNEIEENQNTFNGSAYTQYAGLVFGQDYWVERRGTGSLTADELQDYPPFGFQLKNANTFNEGEVIVIHFYARLSVVNVNQSGGSGSFGFDDIIEITDAIKYLDNTHINKIIDVNNSMEQYVAIRLDNFSNYPDMSRVKILNNRGVQKNVLVRCRIGLSIYYPLGGITTDQIILGKGESIELVKKDDKLYVIDINSAIDDVGIMVKGFVANNNMLPADGSIINRTIDVRLSNWILTNLSIGNGLVTELDWQNNPALRVNFSTGDGSTTFRLPSITGYFIKT